jgi:hypothetical protein
MPEPEDVVSRKSEKHAYYSSSLSSKVEEQKHHVLDFKLTYPTSLSPKARQNLSCPRLPLALKILTSRYTLSFNSLAYGSSLKFAMQTVHVSKFRRFLYMVSF